MMGSVKLFSSRRHTFLPSDQGRRLHQKRSRNSAGNCSRGRDPRMGRMGAEKGGRIWPASLCRHAHPQFRLHHPPLRLKQQQLRLVAVTGTGENIFRVRLSGLPWRIGLVGRKNQIEDIRFLFSPFLPMPLLAAKTQIQRCLCNCQ